MTARRHVLQMGFTMAELAVVLMIFSVLSATAMMEMVTGSAIRSQERTLDNMRFIENALNAYYKVYGVLPCPAPGNVGIQAANYGRVTGTAGVCNADITGFVGGLSGGVLGTVPNKLLNLPDEVALDGWGRRIGYIVDLNYTLPAATAPTPALQTAPTAAASVTGRYPVILVSYGKQGNGAFPANGSTVANRIFTYDTRGNANERENIGVGTGTRFVVRPFYPDAAVAADRFDQIVKPLTLQ